MKPPAICQIKDVSNQCPPGHSERRGTWVYYRVNPDVLARMSAVLVPQPAVGREEILAPALRALDR